mmetsp:Transcript_52348/g.124993  ORF Transcript_52348/g.124993 Transcript_52348/m.124993 type:complete len:445 (+) Transcript_52348:64-1398(+)
MAGNANALVVSWLGQSKPGRRRNAQQEASATEPEPIRQVGRAKLSKGLKDQSKSNTRNALRFGASEAPSKKAKGRTTEIAAAPATSSRRPKVVKAIKADTRPTESESSISSDSEAPQPVAKRPRLASKEPSRSESPTAASASSKARRSGSAGSEATTVPESKLDVQCLSEVGKGTFQEAVLERLKTLCGDSEDATVLAEYVVIMCAGNKGREEMVAELVPFFSEDQVQAQSFIQWVEECKWKFLVGVEVASPPGGKQGEAAVALSASNTKADTTRGTGSSKAASDRPQTHVFHHPAPIQPGPHGGSASPEADQKLPRAHNVFAQVLPAPPGRSRAAVAARAAEETKSQPSFGPAFSKAAIAAKPPPGKLVVAATTPAVNPKLQKASLLENMTKQLREIVTKLSDKTLTPETRAKYQSMAQTLQAQLTKITSTQQQQSKPGRSRR